MDAQRLRELLEARFPAAAGWEGAGLSADETQQLEAAAAEDPALAAELARIEAWDLELDQAFQDLPIPANLADRLLVAVQAPAPLAETVSAATLSSAPESAATIVVAAQQPLTTARPRRVWLAVAGGLALVTVVAVGLQFLPPLSQTIIAESLLAEARTLVQGLDEEAWQSDLQSSQLSDHPTATGALLARPQRWQHLNSSLDRQTIVYDLVGAGRKRAMLLVMRSPGAQSTLASFPARTPESTTEGFSLGAWQQGDLVYVLVVEGSSARFGSFIKEVSTG